MPNECVRIPEGMAKKLKQRAKDTGFKRADIVRAAVAILLAETNAPETGAAVIRFRTGAVK